MDALVKVIVDRAFRLHPLALKVAGAAQAGQLGELAKDIILAFLNAALDAGVAWEGASYEPGGPDVGHEGKTFKVLAVKLEPLK